MHVEHIEMASVRFTRYALNKSALVILAFAGFINLAILDRNFSGLVDSVRAPNFYLPFARIWRPIAEETARLSTACPDFLFYSVSVQSLRSEPRHYEAAAANIRRPECAVLIALLVHSREDKENSLLESKFQSRVDNYTNLGWNVVSRTFAIDDQRSRKVSRIPKLNPKYFFPHTERVLYSDMKFLPTLRNVDASYVAHKLLAGTQFGIVQHRESGDIDTEVQAILNTVASRPYIVDNKNVLEKQNAVLKATLTAEQQAAFGVEGNLHARVLQSSGITSEIFDRVWLEEYMLGSDRDQIAFYGASTRLGMQREKAYACDRFNRSGVYRSDFNKKFTFAIHCSFSSALSFDHISA